MKVKYKWEKWIEVTKLYDENILHIEISVIWTYILINVFHNNE